MAGAAAEFEDYLRVAEVATLEDLSVGVTRPRKAHLAPRGVLSEWVTNGDIRGIIQRRDEMQKLVDKLVAERGEAYVFMHDRSP